MSLCGEEGYSCDQEQKKRLAPAITREGSSPSTEHAQNIGRRKDSRKLADRRGRFYEETAGTPFPPREASSRKGGGVLDRDLKAR